MMESVVLDNVVFEDVISSSPKDQHQHQQQHSNIQHEDRETQSPRVSKIISRQPDPSNAIDAAISTPIYHQEPTFTSYQDPSPSPYPSNFSGDSSYSDAGAFAPEYHQSTYSHAPDSGFLETTFVSEARPTAHQNIFPIDICVIEPEKFGDGMNSYITYKIKTSTSLPKYREASLVVRRYNDFLWLHEQLRLNNKGVLTPPLPEKALINRFSPEFIETRRKELEKFLNRVAQHRILNRRPELQLFLESPDEQFNAVKSKSAKPQPATEQTPPQQQQQSSGGFGKSFVSFLGSSISAAANLTTTSGTAREIDQWFDAKKNYVNALESHLTGLLKSTSKLLAKRKELASAHSEFAASISIVGSTEAETDSFLSTAFIRIGQITEHIRDLGEQLFRNETTHFEEALKDYLRILGAVKDMLTDRDEVLLEYQNATRLFESKKEKLEKEKARGTAKKGNTEREVEEAQRKVEDTKREYEVLSATVKAEIELFDNTRAREIRRMIALLVQSNMEHSLQVVDLWKGYISETQGSDEKDWRTSDKVGWGGIGSLR